MGAITRQRGSSHYWVTSYGFPPDVGEYLKSIPLEPGRSSIVGRALLEARTVHVPDLLADPEYAFRDAQKRAGYRTMLCVPLLREGKPVGVVVLIRRAVRPFSDKQIELATTFADQAVIAIENVRLFDEVQARTEELGESLQQQTATADILTVISNSLDDTQPVFDAIVQSGLKLFADATIMIALADGDQMKPAAVADHDPARIEGFRSRSPVNTCTASLSSTPGSWIFPTRRMRRPNLRAAAATSWRPVTGQSRSCQ